MYVIKWLCVYIYIYIWTNSWYRTRSGANGVHIAYIAAASLTYFRCYQVAYLPPEYLMSAGSAGGLFLQYTCKSALILMRKIHNIMSQIHRRTGAVNGMHWDTYSFAILLAFLFTERPPYHQLHNEEICIQVSTHHTHTHTHTHTR